MRQQPDTTLIREVLRERHGQYEVYAMLSRFGTLAVFVYDHGDNKYHSVWQGDDVLAAREYVEERLLDARGRVTVIR